jgi:hypothetical protein
MQELIKVIARSAIAAMVFFIRLNYHHSKIIKIRSNPQVISINFEGIAEDQTISGISV